MTEGFTSEYLQQERGTRIERFIISTPVLIGTAVGAATIAAAGVTAALVADREVEKYRESLKLKESIGRKMWETRSTTTMSTST